MSAYTDSILRMQTFRSSWTHLVFLSGAILKTKLNKIAGENPSAMQGTFTSPGGRITHQKRGLTELRKLKKKYEDRK